MFIAFEGIDKAGKGTQKRILAKRLEKEGYEVEAIAFPDYSTPLGWKIKAFLRGKIAFCPEVRQLLYTANRWENRDKINTWLKEEKIVIADRYVASGIVYGLANNLDMKWVLELERGLPETDKVFVIDVPVNVAFSREEKKKDVYEEDNEFLTKVREIYLRLAKQFKWEIINGNRSIDEVSKDIWLKTSKILEN